MSSYLSEQLPKWLIWPIAIFFGLFLVCLAVGLLFYDIAQFLGNLLAGLAGLKSGFWFRCFRTAIELTYNHLSLDQHFNRWVANGGRSLQGASEFYQSVIFLIGTLWVTFIDSPVHPVLTNRLFQLIGCIIALYWVTELFLFSLHWTFVAGGRVHSIRRSLAGFLVNLFEIALLFSIVFMLAGCKNSHTTGWSDVYDNLRSVFNLELVTVRETTACSITAHYEITVAATLLVIIIASLVGAIVRPEEKLQDP